MAWEEESDSRRWLSEQGASERWPWQMCLVKQLAQQLGMKLGAEGSTLSFGRFWELKEVQMQKVSQQWYVVTGGPKVN